MLAKDKVTGVWGGGKFLLRGFRCTRVGCSEGGEILAAFLLGVEGCKFRLS